MTAYPFSGEIRGNCIDSCDHPPLEIIDTYCRLLGIDYGIIKKVYPVKPPKVFRGIHLDYVRMALSHYLTYFKNIPAKIAGPMSGYSDHSTVIKNRPKVEYYIKVKDNHFYPYWEKLKSIC